MNDRIWIVVKMIGKPNETIVDVFDNEEAAKICRKNVINKWMPCEIVVKEVKSL